MEKIKNDINQINSRIHQRLIERQEKKLLNNND